MSFLVLVLTLASVVAVGFALRARINHPYQAVREGWATFSARKGWTAQLGGMPAMWGPSGHGRIRVRLNPVPGLVGMWLPPRTELRGAHASALPAGLELERTNIGVEPGTSVEELFAVRGERAPAEALFTQPEVEDALRELAAIDGRMRLDHRALTVRIEGAVADPDAIGLLVDRAAAVLEALHTHAPAQPEASPAPVARPSLSSLLQRAVAAGISTRTGKELLESLRAEACVYRVEVERVAADEDRLGAPRGHRVVGLMPGASCRVEVRFPAEHDHLVQSLTPGQIIEGDGFLDAYDTLRDHAEIKADGPPKLVKQPKRGPTPDDTAALLLGALADPNMDDDARNELLAQLAQEQLTLRVHVQAAIGAEDGAWVEGTAQGIPVHVRRLPGKEPPVSGARWTVTARADGFEDGTVLLKELHA